LCLSRVQKDSEELTIFLAWSPDLGHGVCVVETLAEFIARRRRELDNAEARLRAKLSEIGRERDALKAAEKAGVSTNINRDQEEYKKRRKIKPNTIMFDVINILREHPRGMIALDILAELNTKRDYPLERTSLSPQLSRLKGAGYIDLQGSNWALRSDDDLQL
jgi:hypothetical protein